MSDCFADKGNTIILPLLKLPLTLVSRKRLSILIYHRVHERKDPLIRNAIDKRVFDWQMRVIADAFNVLNLSDAVSLMTSGSLPPRSLAITFDDGYADNYEVALPVLQKYGLTATFFVSSGYLDGGRMWNDTIIETVRTLPDGIFDLSSHGLGTFNIASITDRRLCFQQIIDDVKHMPYEKRLEVVESISRQARSSLPDDLMMTSSQLKQLSDSGMTVGGHTVSHPILSMLEADTARDEIIQGKRELESILGKEIDLFAYPNGRPGTDYSDEHVNLVKGAGFKLAVSTAKGVSDIDTDLYQLKRFTPWDRTPGKFMARLIANYFN
ncbi:MAG: polysaccharide deacetylase family protein [Sedimenticola sp.]